MSQDSVNAAAVGSVSVAGKTATPQQSAVNIGSSYPHISSLINHAGLRYPICAALQGGSLIYSPMMGQTIFPWRPFAPVATPTTPVSAVVPNMNLISQPTQTTPSKPVSLASLMQVPSYSYMTVSSLLGTGTSSSPSEEPTQQYTGVPIKRENSEEHSPKQSAIKRPRMTHDLDASNTLEQTHNSPASKLLQPGSSSTSPTEVSYHQQQQTMSLMRIGGNLRDYCISPVNIVLIRCLGVIDSNLVDQCNVKMLSLMQDLYNPSRTSSSANVPTLPPETHILLTINYLNSLIDGECVNLEMMRWIFHNTLFSENQWVNYYRKHKKMTESTFVQLQFSHFVRISNHQNSGNVAVVVSQSSLSEGIVLALHSIKKSGQSLLPKFIIVVAVLQNIPSEMCIIVTDELQCKWLVDLQQFLKPSIKAAAAKDTQFQRLSLSRDILMNMKRSQLHTGGDNVLSPFLAHGKDVLLKEEAEQMVPPLSNVIEHRPNGPFTKLYDMALHMLQRILNAGHLDQYQKLDFFILCPTYPPLISQLINDIQENGLIQLLGIGNHRDEILQAITQRIVKCSPSSMESMNNTIKNNRHVLFLVIVKCSHVISNVTTTSQPILDTTDSSLHDNRTCDCRSMLSHNNTIMLYTSAHPYALQTNRSLISASNEIHWPHSLTRQNQSNSEMSSGMEFCSLLKYKSAIPIEMWASVREDSAFEDNVLKACSSEQLITPICLIRSQALLNDYANALISAVKQKINDHVKSLPETLSIVLELVQRPLTNKRGHGSMIIIRCHNRTIGSDLFNKIKVIRNILGLQYRFEVILDHGDDKITISEYFQKRLKLSNAAKGVNSLSYLDLDNLPCLVIMTGRVHPGIRLPSSLSHVDLRLCHTCLNRTLYESDLSLMNGYRHIVNHGSKQSSINNYKSDKHTSVASSSSMISNDAHVVEWGKPTKDVTSDHAHWDKNIHSPSYKPQFEYNSTDMDCTNSPAINGGVAIVEIPQPEDHMTTSFNEPVIETEENIFNDLDSDSDCDDSDSENDDVNQRRLTCLMSRQYYLIWRSGTVVDQMLLLPPANGVVWQMSSKWTQLTDHTPSVQSSYYRSWSKPEGKNKRVAIDTVLKENLEGRLRCFLFTGPSQIGKMGACLLLVRLLHEYLRSSRGVAAIAKPPIVLPMVRHTPPPSPMATIFSPIVSVEYLTSSIHDHGNPSHFCPSTLDTKQNSVLINAHPSISHDSFHSCPKCSSASPSSNEPKTSVNYILSSMLQCNSSSLSVQWSIPSSKTDLVVIATNNTIECIRLPPNDSSHRSVPIFSISPDLKESALLNLSHTAYDHLHIIITKSSNLSAYQNAWPTHVIVALPDYVFSGLGSCLNAVKCLGQWNYMQNIIRNKNLSPLAVSPWLLTIDDSVCMILKETEEKSIDISCLLDTLVNIDKDLFSLRPWSTDSLHLSSHPLHYALNANFLLMNLSKLHDFNFNPLNFKSADVDYHLRLLANQYTVCVPSEYSFVKKLIKSEKPVSLADLSPQLVSNPDRLVTSLHHDASSLLSYPGPLLLETFLLHKSHSLFPTAHTPNHPVLMIDNYINLGPKVHITLLPCKQLEELINKDVLFGGLVLYLCEGLVSSHMLQKMKFISGACLLLITRDCKALVKEVSRLDIEEYWHFKLRDEFQTACSDQYQPLFFLTGKYVSSTIDVS